MKKIIAVKVSVYGKTHVDFHKTSASTFSAYTTSTGILKILFVNKVTNAYIKWIVF